MASTSIESPYQPNESGDIADGDIDVGSPDTSRDALPMMEMFDESTFDAVTWLNASLHAQADDATLGMLSRAVDDSIHASHVNLERALTRALSAVPWAVRESEKVRQRASTLRVNVDGVGERVAGVEAGVASSVDTIARADDVVRRVEAVTSLLTQASQAERLQSQLEALLGSSGADGSDLVTAADVLARLRTELKPLEQIPELQERFRALDTADAKLESMAAPQLRSALENRNGAAAANARVVFDRAGRENAFVAQYVAIRAAQVAKLWTAAWEAWVDSASSPRLDPLVDGADLAEGKTKNATGLKAKRRVLRGDISAEDADGVLSAFYGNLQDLILTEATWLDTAFPDLRVRLLPSLLVTVLSDLDSPSLRRPSSFGPSSTAEGESAASQALLVPERMHAAALESVAAAARICQAILPPWEDELFSDDGFNALALEAVSAALLPHRLFLEAASDAHALAARKATAEITLSSEAFFLYKPPVARQTPQGSPPRETPRPPPVPSLNELARDIESFGTQAVSILDKCLGVITEQSVGVGLKAMSASASAVAGEASSRILRILKHSRVLGGGGGTPDEWARVSGSLRLLQAMSSLKCAWDGRKEFGYAAAIGTATPALEASSILLSDGRAESRLQRFVDDVSNDTMDLAAMVWELVRDETLGKEAVETFEALDKTDLEDVLDAAHRVVYENMIAGVRGRFTQFGGKKVWNATSGDEQAASLGASPLPYATEVADYLMTVPQQLEPFVPDEELAEYATPKTAYGFSKSRAGAGGEEDDELANGSFAGMWMHVLAVGVMELYVEKICGISKLSDLGARQLGIDTEYLCSVMGALGVNPTLEMRLVRTLIEGAAVQGVFEDAAKEVSAPEARKVMRRVAAMRGVSVTI